MDAERREREVERYAREAVLETMWDGNQPMDYYGPDDPVWQKHKVRCRTENEAELDVYAAAVEARLRADMERDALRYRALRGEPEKGEDFAPVIEGEGADPSVGIFTGYVAVTYGWSDTQPPKFTTLDALADWMLADAVPAHEVRVSDAPSQEGL